MKKIKVFLTVILVLGIMAAPLLAGTVTVNHAGNVNIPVGIAYEALGIARTVIASGTASSTSTTVAVSYEPGASATISDSIRFELGSGINFPNTTVRLCLASTTGNTVSSTQVDAGTPSAGATNVTFSNTLATAITAGSLLYLSNASNCAAASNLSVNVPANTPAGIYTINATIVGKDTAAAKNLVGVFRQYTPSLAAANLVNIDYLAATTGNPKDGTHFVAVAPGTNLIAGIAGKIVTNSSTTTAGSLIDYPANGAAPGFGITFTQAINLTDTAAWQGVTRVYSTNNQSCTYANNTASNTTPVGTITLNPAASKAAFNGTAAANETLCVLAAGNVQLNRRTITGSVYYTATTGGIAPPEIINQVMMLWVPNGYQAFNPYMYVGADQTVDVFNRFYNNSSQTAQVFCEVFPADGSAAQVFALANIPSNSSGLYWGSDIGPLAGLPVGTSFAARFTITTDPASVNGVSFFKRTTGERQMPLYKTNDATYLMQ